MWRSQTVQICIPSLHWCATHWTVPRSTHSPILVRILHPGDLLHWGGVSKDHYARIRWHKRNPLIGGNILDYLRIFDLPRHETFLLPILIPFAIALFKVDVDAAPPCWKFYLWLVFETVAFYAIFQVRRAHAGSNIMRRSSLSVNLDDNRCVIYKNKTPVFVLNTSKRYLLLRKYITGWKERISTVAWWSILPNSR